MNQLIQFIFNSHPPLNRVKVSQINDVIHVINTQTFFVLSELCNIVQLYKVYCNAGEMNDSYSPFPFHPIDPHTSNPSLVVTSSCIIIAMLRALSLQKLKTMEVDSCRLKGKIETIIFVCLYLHAMENANQMTKLLLLSAKRLKTVLKSTTIWFNKH